MKIVSGGQTGVDRAALDVAIGLGLACGGWCPKGRKAEDGPIPDDYPLKETKSADYAERTRLNVCDSDATLVLTRGTPTGGTALTLTFAEKLGRPSLVIDLAADDGDGDVARVQDWITEAGIATLNLAGPRESNHPGIHDEAQRFLKAVFAVT
jgi:hypothetical protein